MATPSFYHPSLNEQDSIVNLSAAEASHAVSARRLKVGHKVRLFDGLGLVAYGELSTAARRTVAVSIKSFERLEKPNKRLTIAVASPKGDRQKNMLDMLTQLGVSDIIPLSCEYSITKFNDKVREKWQRVVIEAAKQSQNPFLPIIHKNISLNDLISDTSKTVLVANAGGQSILELNFPLEELIVVVGPEGGFSDAEFDLFENSTITSIALGGHILRTEAAAVAAAAQFNVFKL